MLTIDKSISIKYLDKIINDLDKSKYSIAVIHNTDDIELLESMIKTYDFPLVVNYIYFDALTIDTAHITLARHE